MLYIIRVTSKSQHQINKNLKLFYFSSQYIQLVNFVFRASVRTPTVLKQWAISAHHSWDDSVDERSNFSDERLWRIWLCSLRNNQSKCFVFMECQTYTYLCTISFVIVIFDNKRKYYLKKTPFTFISRIHPFFVNNLCNPWST